jgi:U3 small nucleolar RNA-associated protein 3
LDGTDAVARNRELEEYDDEEEVFALKGLDGDDYDNEDPDDGEEDEDEDEEDGDIEAESAPSRPKSKKTKAALSKSATSKSVEEEIESEDEERWGKTKSAYYSSAANEADPDDEEARAMEETEARRLQGKARESMNDDDFGFEDVVFDGGASSYVQSKDPLRLCSGC